MQNGHDSRAVANFFIDLSLKERKPISNMTCVKLVFLAHGWSLAITGEPLCSDQPETFSYGPSFPQLYTSLRGKGSSIITEPLNHFIGKEIFHTFASSFSENDISIMKRIFDVYAHLGAFQLSNMLNAEGTPWHATVMNAGKMTKIPHSLLKDYYDKELQKNRQKQN
jgi:uncharacterized phage-associated protein